MKKTRLLSIILSVVLVLGCVPMMAVSADELTDLDVSTVLSVDSSYTGTIDETDPYISTDYWNGYAKGFTVELEPDVIYTIEAYVGYYYGTVGYVDRAIAVIPYGASDVSGNDIAYTDNSRYDTSGITTTLKFAVTEAGKYHVIVWGFFEDENGDAIYGDGANVGIELSESPAIKFDKKLTVGKSYTGTVNETDLYIETSDWSGYVQGFYADLKAGEYKITATVSGEGATYADRAIAVHPDGAVVDAYEDAIAYNSKWEDADTATVSVIFVVEKAGIYKIPVWGYLDDENGDGIFGEGTSLTVLIDDELTQEDYLGMPVTATLTVGTAYEGFIDETDPYIYTYGYNGYAKAFAVELEAGKLYSAYAYAECADADNIDRAIAIVPEKFMGDFSEDSIAYADDYETEDGKAVIDFFTVEEDGTYYVIEWGYCHDEYGDELTGDSTYLEVCVDYAETSVIDIYTSDDLVQFNADMHDGKYEGILDIIFHDDIDMTDIAWDSTFGTEGIYFNVNGNGYTITNLSGPLLGNAYDAYIYDLDMSVDLEFVTDPESGGEVYDFGLYAGYVENNIVMNNCHVTGDIVFDGYTNDGLGALVGRIYGEGYSKFVNCSFEGSITVSGGYSIGGLVGDAEYNTTFENCYANVTIDAHGCGNIGGLVGYVEDYNSFDRCYAIVDIDGEYGYNIGGLAGIIDEDNLFIDCYAEGTVQGEDDIGGLVGDSSCCGYNNFINCYTTVDVTGEYYLGGFIGEAYDYDNFENCYAAGSVTCTDSYYSDYAGMFFGYASEDTMTFTNCFAAYSEDYGTYGYINGEINGIIYSVNFDDEASVANMEDTLNEYVEANSGLYYWAGRNDANGPEFSETPPFIKGDINGDDKVNMFDYVALKSHVLGKSLLSDDKLVRADVNGDGRINMFDYVALKAQVIKG